jgi:hypothetical protein
MKQFRDTRYWVSENGEVSSYYPERIATTKSTYKNKTYYGKTVFPEKWKSIKPILNNGYYNVDTSSNNIKEKFLIHRMVAELYVPGYFKGAHVDHIDCDKSNNHPSNLQWCTQEYNNSKGDKLTFPLYSEWCK